MAMLTESMTVVAVLVLACKRDLALPLGMDFMKEKKEKHKKVLCQLSVKESRSILTDSSLMRTAFDYVLNPNINQSMEGKWKYLEFNPPTVHTLVPLCYPFFYLSFILIM